MGWTIFFINSARKITELPPTSDFTVRPIDPAQLVFEISVTADLEGANVIGSLKSSKAKDACVLDTNFWN